MPVAEQLDIERLRKQSEFLLRVYRAELAQDPASRATQSSRSNVIALQHTVGQTYGDAVAVDVANLVTGPRPCNHFRSPTPSFRVSIEK